MIKFDFEKVDSIDSTNDQLERELNDGKITCDKILIAREQTNGHGTNERNFLSMRDKGIYFSFLHFYKDSSELSFITQKVAVAVYKVFKDIFNIELNIKWVNDLYYNDKKVVGILCRNLIKYKAVLIGVGIDLFCNDDLPDELLSIVGSIFKDKKDLIYKLSNNKRLSKETCVYKNIYDDFKSIELEGIDIVDDNLWEADALVVQIMTYILNLINIKGLPQLYIEKNIIKDDKIYEDFDLQC